MTTLHAVPNPPERSPLDIAPADSLPQPLTSFIGRDAETLALLNLVVDPRRRLISVIGTGGIGKTRLALQVAHRCRGHFRDGVVFLGLADVRDPGLLPSAMAHALGAHNATGGGPADHIRHHCRDANLLVVVDNLEHLLDAVSFLPEMLGSCPGITLLATSRNRLQLGGESVFELGPLAMDHAVELFEERALAIAPEFAVAPHTRQDIVRTCQHLDGLPLAIELAAARVPVLAPNAMLERLDNLMGLLSGGLRDAPDRHRGIRKTISWSYQLLTADEQALFRRLSVFDGGFTLEAVTAVAGDTLNALECLAGLEASSLVKLRPGSNGASRFQMLETVREFARERLREQGEEAATCQAHAKYFALLADDTEWRWWLTGGPDKLDQLEPEMPNLRAALSWLQLQGNVPAVLRLAGSLVPMWTSRGYRQEGRAWLEWGLPLSDGTPRDTVVVALRALAWILNTDVPTYRSLVVAQSALELANELGDPRNRAASLLLSAIAGNQLGLREHSINWCLAALDILDTNSGQEWAPIMRCIATNIMGFTYIDVGRVEVGEIWLNQTLELQHTRDLRLPPGASVLGGLGDIARMRGDPQLALSHFRSALQHASNMREVRLIATHLASIAGTIAELGHYEAAGKLFGAVEACFERLGEQFVPNVFVFQRALGLPEPWASMHPEWTVTDELRLAQWERTAPIRAIRLDADQAQRWWEEGRALTLDEAVALIPSLEPRPPSSGTTLSGLSPREVDVLRLLALGLADRDIAASLSISPRTVQNHVQNIYRKIDVSSRSAATRWALVNELG